MSVYLSHLKYIFEERQVAAMQCQMDCEETGEILDMNRYSGICATYTEIISSLEKAIRKAKALERKSK